ncbi:MAG: guanylate kinase [Pseudomonadota bacterium]
MMNGSLVQRRGLLLVLSSPSGAGKSTIATTLLDSEDNLVLSVSATTRPKRPGEEDGTHYHFTDADAFAVMVERNELLEHALVFGHRYGTPRAPVEAALERGQDILFDVDWQGAQQLRDRMPADLVQVFVLPPSASELHDRLRSRASDPEDVVLHRMSRASDEMSHWDSYDYVVINQHLETSVEAVRDILRAERLRRERQIGLGAFINDMRRELDDS